MLCQIQILSAPHIPSVQLLVDGYEFAVTVPTIGTQLFQTEHGDPVLNGDKSVRVVRSRPSVHPLPGVHSELVGQLAIAIPNLIECRVGYLGLAGAIALFVVIDLLSELLELLSRLLPCHLMDYLDDQPPKR